MKKIAQALLLLSGFTIASASLVLIAGLLARKGRLRKIANEGYETANDILYPTRVDSYKLHFGPVHPGN